MNEDIHLSKDELYAIQSFQEKIETLKISNDDKIYLHSFINSILSENYIGAVSIGFVFIEKFLRTELLLVKYNERNNTGIESLNKLDELETELENGILLENNKKLTILINTLKSYGSDNNISEDKIMNDLITYTNSIKSTGPLKTSLFSFNVICRELEELGIFNKSIKNDLISFYSTYRNPAQHGLLKKLFSSYNPEKETLVMIGGGKSLDVTELKMSKSHILFREFQINPIMKDVSTQIFNKIHELITFFGRRPKEKLDKDK